MGFVRLQHSHIAVQGDTSGSSEPPDDFKTKDLFWPGLPWPGQVKAELLFCSQQEVQNYLMCHPVEISPFHFTQRVQNVDIQHEGKSDFLPRILQPHLPPPKKTTM